MKILIPFLFALCFSLPSHGQDSINAELKLIKEIPTAATFMTTDRLGNCYLAKGSYIWMYNKDGDSLRAFNSKRFGNISFIDATDPYKILLFHQDYGTIQFLDNFLAENGAAIDLLSLSFDQATLACHSRENGFWVYDPIVQKAKRLNRSFQITHETVVLSQWFGAQLQPDYMLEYNQQLYLNVGDRGILVFDQFATYQKTIPLQSIENPQPMESYIYYLDGPNFCDYSLIDFESNCQPLAAEDILNGRIEKDRIYILEAGKLKIYRPQ